MIDHLATVRRSTTDPDEFQIQASNGRYDVWLIRISIEERELYSPDIPDEVLQHFPRMLGMPAVRDRIRAVLPEVFAGRSGDGFQVLDHAKGSR